MKSKIEKWLAGLKWIDGTPLQIEEYRLDLFRKAFSTNLFGRRKYSLVLSGRGKKNWKSADLALAGLYSLTMVKAAQGNDVLIIANSEDQAGDDLDLARKIVEANPHLLAGLEPLSKEIRRKDGKGTMRVLPSQNVAAMHGKTACMLGFDEIHAMTDWSILEALAPDPTRECLTWITSYDSILDVEGAPLHDLKTIGKAGTDSRMLFSWYSGETCTDPNFAHLPPEERANPSMASWPEGRAYLDQQRRRLPSSRYRRLHLNLPGAVQGAFFSQDMVDAAIVKGRSILDPMPGIRYRAAVDMSGGSRDDAVFSISYWDGAKTVIAGIWQQTDPTPFNPRLAVAKFAAIAKSYGCTEVAGDAYAGETFRRDFSDCGLSYRVIAHSRTDLYEALEVALNGQMVELPDDAKLRRQMLTIVRRGAVLDHQPGGFDDYVTAVAIASVISNPGFVVGGAAGWIEFYARQVEARDDESDRLKRLQEQPASRMTADMDDFRPAGPDFGFNFNPAPPLMVKVPPEIARERRMPLRWRGGEAFAEMTRADASQWMQNPVWAGLNPDIARQLAGAEVQRIDYVTIMVPAEIAATVVTDVDGNAYHTKIENGRSVVRMPADAARDLLNSGAPSCVAWHRENAFLAARIGARR